MKKIIFILIHTFLFASVPDQNLKHYQERYTFCHGKTNYQITECLLNGSLNYSRVRGERNTYRKVNKDGLKKAELNGNTYHYVMNLLPHTKRYTGLKNYLDYLYSIKGEYTPPRFKGNTSEDIIRIKKVLNLLQNAGLEENIEHSVRFDDEILEYQRRHGLEVDGVIGPNTKRELKQILSTVSSQK